MSDSLPPLLITATLDAGNTPLVALRDTRERTLKHMEGLLSWLKDSSIHRIVFAKNCTAKIKPEVLIGAAEFYGKELEFIQVDASPRTVIQGKGYGEGDMVSQVLAQSEIIRATSSFLKITGKLYAPSLKGVFHGTEAGEFFISRANASKSNNWFRQKLSPLYRHETHNAIIAIMRRNGRLPWGLLAALPRGWIDTRLYRVNREFYQSRLLCSHRRVQDALNYTLENAVFDDLEGDENVRLIESDPQIIGTSGSLGCAVGEFPEDLRLEAKETTERLIF